MRLIKRYLEETIAIKSMQRRRISKLEKQNGELLIQLDEVKENEKYALESLKKEKNARYKEHQKNKELEKQLKTTMEELEKIKKYEDKRTKKQKK